MLDFFGFSHNSIRCLFACVCRSVSAAFAPVDRHPANDQKMNRGMLKLKNVQQPNFTSYRLCAREHSVLNVKTTKSCCNNSSNNNNSQAT